MKENRIMYMMWILGLIIGIVMSLFVVGNWGLFVLGVVSFVGVIWSFERIVVEYEEWKLDRAFKLEMGLIESDYTRMMKLSKYKLVEMVLFSSNVIKMLFIVCMMFIFVSVVFMLFMKGIYIDIVVFGIIGLLRCLIFGLLMSLVYRFGRLF